jgi:hypothetical protein
MKWLVLVVGRVASRPSAISFDQCRPHLGYLHLNRAGAGVRFEVRVRGEDRRCAGSTCVGIGLGYLRPISSRPIAFGRGEETQTDTRRQRGRDVE